MAVIRPYRPTDRSAVGEVCVRTGDAGEDASALYTDPDLLPSIFAWPYVEFEPQLAFVLDDGGTAVGYVLGTADSEAFVERVRREWLPRLAPRYPRPSGPPATPTDSMIGLLHEPERMLVQHVVADHPAHLHIDILPGHQGVGYGRALMTEFLRALGRAGVPRVHLGVSERNTRARAFYDRLGFYEIPVDLPGVTFMGRATLP